MGIFSGIAIDVAQVMGYAYVAENDHPELLLVPVVTNVLSGIYEIRSIAEIFLHRVFTPSNPFIL